MLEERGESWKDCMMPENSQLAPSLRLANTRAPQRGDSAVSTFAGRMEQRCVVALGKSMGSWASPVEADSIRGGRELGRRWGRRFTLGLCTIGRGFKNADRLPGKISKRQIHRSWPA